MGADVSKQTAPFVSVVLPRGEIGTYFSPVTAKQILFRYPHHVMMRCDGTASPKSMHLLHRKALLKPGKKYYVVPRSAVKKLERSYACSNIVHTAACTTTVASQFWLDASMETDKARAFCIKQQKRFAARRLRFAGYSRGGCASGQTPDRRLVRTLERSSSGKHAVRSDGGREKVSLSYKSPKVLMPGEAKPKSRSAAVSPHNNSSRRKATLPSVNPWEMNLGCADDHAGGCNTHVDLSADAVDGRQTLLSLICDDVLLQKMPGRGFLVGGNEQANAPLKREQRRSPHEFRKLPLSPVSRQYRLRRLRRLQVAHASKPLSPIAETVSPIAETVPEL